MMFQRAIGAVAPAAALGATILVGIVSYATTLMLIDRPFVSEVMGALPWRHRSFHA